MPQPPPDTEKLLTQISTTLWGAYGSNGLNAESKRHGEQIGQLFGKTEQISSELERRLGGIYRMLATLTVSMLVGAFGIIATLVVTK